MNKKVYTVPTPRVQKPQQPQKSQGEMLKTIQFSYIPDKATQKDQQKVVRPYLMFKPKLIEEIDENNMKKMKLSFHNSITDLQTFEEMESQQRESTPNLNQPAQEKTKTFVRKSMRHLTQL